MAAPVGQRLTAKRRALFLDALASCGNITQAARSVGISRDTVYRQRGEDADFAARWDSALEEAADVLEAEAWRRAHDGTEEPIVSMGKLVSDPATGAPLTVRKYSDSLMQFLLRGMRPQKYRDNVSVTAQATNFGVTLVMERIQNDPRYAERANEFARLIAGAATEGGSPS